MVPPNFTGGLQAVKSIEISTSHSIRFGKSKRNFVANGNSPTEMTPFPSCGRDISGVISLPLTVLLHHRIGVIVEQRKVK